jgi:crotonobetainyl-CoA:carnitine CoA-transferase CaiB-like acyl-CoA transferase
MSDSNFLADVRIVTMAQYVPGPLAVARLHEAGARVTKIEPPSGDPLRQVAPTWYDELHAGIDVEQLDLKADSGRARALELVASADLLITSQRPSRLSRLGFDADALLARFPRLRVLRIVGSVREPEEAGHDLTYQAQAGFLGDEMPRTLVADVVGAERIFGAALALLMQPPGATIDVGLVESLDGLVAPIRHRLTTLDGPLGGRAPQYRVYAAKTGRVAVAALEPHFERALYEQLGLAPRSDLTARMRERTAEEWEVWARERDLPLVAVNDALAR